MVVKKPALVAGFLFGCWGMVLRLALSAAKPNGIEALELGRVAAFVDQRTWSSLSRKIAWMRRLW